MGLERTALPHRHEDIFASAARAEATYNSDTFKAFGRLGIRLWLKITGETGTATLDVKLQGYDESAEDWADVAGAAFAQKSATGGPFMLTVYPGATVAANVSVSDALPNQYRVVAVVGGSTVTMTFTVGADLLA